MFLRPGTGRPILDPAPQHLATKGLYKLLAARTLALHPRLPHSYHDSTITIDGF